MQMIAEVARDIISGLLWFIETGGDLGAGLFEFMPFGNPCAAAIVMGLVFVAVDRIVRPRTPVC